VVALDWRTASGERRQLDRSRFVVGIVVAVEDCSKKALVVAAKVDDWRTVAERMMEAPRRPNMVGRNWSVYSAQQDWVGVLQCEHCVVHLLEPTVMALE